jgi:hypothetical protein
MWGGVYNTYSPMKEQEKETEKDNFTFGASALLLLFEPEKNAFDSGLLK